MKHVFVNLGKTPLSNAYLNQDELFKPEHSFPLCTYVCEKCFLVQIPEFEKPENIFREYLYFSSFSKSWIDHAKKYVDFMLKHFDIDKEKLVIEIASNDGYLLQFFKENSIPVLGIEPAVNVAKYAELKGIPTITEFFGTTLASKLRQDGKQADLIIGNNVLAHVPNINDFVKGLQYLLKPNGIITMEFPHLLQLIKNTQFDTIYHEHFSYLSLLVVKKIFSRHNLKIFKVDELSTHGGSLRIYAAHESNHIAVDISIKRILDDERNFGLDDLETYTNFSNKVTKVKNDLLSFLHDVKIKNKTVVCYGAAAKGNTLLNFCGIGSDIIEYVVDRNNHKQGKYLPGSHLPIKAPEEVSKTKPDYLLILPWNIKDEIIQQMDFVRKWGGKFVILIPSLEVFD
ncbi:methyltransferase domain-containing protein [Nitrosopumilus sp. S4]